MGNYRSGNKNAHDNLVGKKKGGRPRGTPNKITTEVKKDLNWVVRQLGGRKAMLNFYKDKKGELYNYYFKYNIPKESEVKVEGNFTVTWSEDDTKIKGPI